MKRIVSLLLSVLLMLTLLAGCAAAGSSSSSAGSSAAQSAEHEDFYSVCTNFSKTEVEQFARQVKEQLLSSDWAGLAENIAYPITIAGVTYADSAAFVKAPFDTLLDKAFLDAIQNESCTEMFCNSDGIMLGSGEIWIAELLDDSLQSQGLRVISINVFGGTQTLTLKPGTWLAYGAGEYTYYFFDADGSSGRTLRQSDGMGLPFSYAVQGSDVTFYMGSPDTPAPAALTFQDEYHATLQWKEGIAEELTYLSDDTSDTFQFFSDDELCTMAVQYYKAHAQNTDDLSGLTAAAAANEDGTVSIQLYENLGDHNSTYAWYTVDRQSAKGTDSASGEAVNLNPGA